MINIVIHCITKSGGRTRKKIFFFYVRVHFPPPRDEQKMRSKIKKKYLVYYNMEYFSGRFDLDDTLDNFLEQIVENYFPFILSHSEPHFFIMAYEEHTKMGIPCKPHVHYIMHTTKNYDQLRYFIKTELGFIGPTSSIKSVKKDTLNKALTYVVKQQKVVLYTINKTQLENILEISKTYNDSIKVLNNDEIIVEAIRLIKEKSYSERIDYIKTLFYLKGLYPKFNLPTGNQLLKLVQHIEREVLPPQDAFYMYVLDNQNILDNTPRDVLERLDNDNKLVLENYTIVKPEYKIGSPIMEIPIDNDDIDFIDSPDEEEKYEEYMKDARGQTTLELLYGI